MTREQRLRERETAKILKEEELRRLKENEQKLATNAARLSERHLKAMMKQHEIDLKRLNEEEDWFFDCEKCGTYGSNLVCLLTTKTSAVANISRTITRLRSHAIGAMYGSIRSATVLPKSKRRMLTSSSYAVHVSVKRRKQASRSYHH
jgi:hypothetical protein